MPHADLEDLAGLALGHDDLPPDVRNHVAACADCAALVEAFAEARRLAGGEPLTAPPEHVREQVLAHVRDGGAARPIPFPATPAAEDADRSPAPVRDLDSRRRAVPVWAAGLAAALALVAGLGLGRLTGDDPAPPEAQDPPVDTGTVVAATALTALDSDDDRGEASAVRTDDTFTIRVRASELGAEDGVHEVWLINVDGTRMISIGLLASGDEGEFDVPMRLLDEGYRIVDISIEPDDGDPTHSGVSLARGELA